MEEREKLTREQVEAILQDIILENMESKTATNRRFDKEMRTRAALQRCTLEACRLYLINDRQRELQKNIDRLEATITAIKMATG